ncbi:MAG: pyrroline-5-carboxylate reductase [Tannerellaceae bacterium]|nr:pyrroline-5-carboxylate reductase [Tannerellaceae bacterium]
MKIAIIGAGNMGGAIATGLAKGSIFQPADIICADKNQENLDKLQASTPGLLVTTDNKQAVSGADIVLLAVKPWLIEPVIEEIKNELDYDKQQVGSIAAGITFEQLSSYLQKTGEKEKSTPVIYRIIPNTAIAVGSSMTFVSAQNASPGQMEFMVNLFGELGSAMVIEEKQIVGATALASCGIAYALRYLRAAMAGGIELGFYPQQAQEIVALTMKGAVDLILANQTHPETEIDRVTTPGGITIKGLNEMEANGFTTAVIRGLKASK